ncbi:hypothetical protein ACFWBI_09175 [Streptomyces sp. NPDC059982]|uniref:hypothetical protein n=1 Tax=unclassified Streptomyces TaxID=2593676 RepID=UPI003695A085
MPLPTTRVVTGHYVNPVTGAPATGRIVLAPYPGVWTDEAGNQVLTGGATLALVDGAFSQALVTSDAAGVEPATGRLWVVEERIVGCPYRRRAFELAAGVGSIAITDLVVADPAAAGYVRGPAGPQGPQPPLGAAGTGPTTALRSDDASTTNARPPTAHASTHAAGDSDPVTPAAIGAATASALAAHAGGSDAHGDRAWSSSQFYPLQNGNALDSYLGDLLTRVAAIEGGTAFLAALNSLGRIRIVNNALHIEGSGGTIRHVLDGAANKLGFHGATPVTQQAISGSRGDGSALADLLAKLATLGLITDSTGAGPAGSGWGDRPADQGLLDWTYDPNMAGHVTAQSNAGVAGRITLVRIILRQPITWANIWIGLAGIDAAASLANCYLGVYSSGGTLLGVTADISSSLMTGATAKALPLTTPFAAPAGTYFIGMLLNGTWATNSLTFKASGAGISVNAGLTAPNLRYSNMLAGQTSLPASLTLASQTTTIINTGWASQWYGVS